MKRTTHVIIRGEYHSWPYTEDEFPDRLNDIGFINSANLKFDSSDFGHFLSSNNNESVVGHWTIQDEKEKIKIGDWVWNTSSGFLPVSLRAQYRVMNITEDVITLRHIDGSVMNHINDGSWEVVE